MYPSQNWHHASKVWQFLFVIFIVYLVILEVCVTQELNRSGNKWTFTTMKSRGWPDLLEKGLESDQASICRHFPDHIIVRLQQFPDVETVFMEDLVARATGSEQKLKPCSSGHKRI